MRANGRTATAGRERFGLRRSLVTGQVALSLLLLVGALLFVRSFHKLLTTDAWFNRAGPGYFKTMGIGLLAGREFNDQDRVASTQVAIVNEEFARKYFHGINSVGHTFHREMGAGKAEPLFQIVGLVRNTKYYDLREEFRPSGFELAADDAVRLRGKLITPQVFLLRRNPPKLG